MDRCAARLFALTSSLALASAVLVFDAEAAWADPVTESESVERGPLYRDSTAKGLLFVEGDYIPGPYSVTATDSRVLVNGKTVRTLSQSESSRPNSSELSNTERRQSGSAFDRNADWESDRPRQRRSRFGGDRDRFRSREREPSAVRAAHELTESLDSDAVVVMFADHEQRVISSGSEVFDFCTALLADAPTAEEAERFRQLAHGNSHAVWSQWLNTVQLDGSLKAQLTERMDAIVAAQAENVRQVAAVHRLEQFSYPLTLAAMVIGVLALGHMLKWAARGLDEAEGTGEGRSPAIRATEVALLLMLAMAAIDLLWTILAGQAGVMKEINPIASGFIDSPLRLTLFKLAATLAGCGILYAWRQRRQIQQATWWVCLVCVLVTFRWVMFDSMLG